MTWGILTTKLGGTDITDGNVLYGEDLVETLDTSSRIINQVYEDTGYDSTQNGNGTNENNHEMDSISSDDLKGSNYVKVTITNSLYLKVDTTNATARVRIKIQTKEVGGSYTDSLAYTTLILHDDDNGNIDEYYNSKTFTYYHLLSAGEKNNGIQVNVFSESYVVNGNVNSDKAEFDNIQTVIEVV